MKFEIAMTTFNRSEVLKDSLNSLSNTIIDDISNLYIFDDCSTDLEVYNTIEDFKEKTKEKFNVIFKINENNLGCDDNMCKVINFAFDNSNNPFVITIDSDVIYNKNWLKFMEIAYNEMVQYENISLVSVYDSRVHKVIAKYDDIFNIKSSVGGLCALLRKNIFRKISENKSWDWKFVEASNKEFNLLLCSKSSLIQHIGKVGAHSLDGNMYDFSDTFVGE